MSPSPRPPHQGRPPACSPPPALKGHRTSRRPRAGTDLRCIALQVAAIVAVAIAIGLIDGRGWTAKLTPDAHAPVLQTPTPGGNPPAPALPKPPVDVVTKPPQAPTVPTPAATDPKPGEPGWKPKTEAEMRDKPGHVTLSFALDQQNFKLATFLDARNHDEFVAGHIPGAHLAPLSAFRENKPPAILSTLPKDSPIIVYCAGGDCEASEDVSLLLQTAGHTQVFVLHDGYPGWAAMGYPTEKGEPTQ